MKDNIPQWKKNQQEYKIKYNREHAHKVCISLYDEHLLEIWRSIPDKAQWFKDKLREHEKENSG